MLKIVSSHQNIIKLLKQEKASCHALPAWNGVTLAGGTSDKLEHDQDRWLESKKIKSRDPEFESRVVLITFIQLNTKQKT